MTQSLKHVSAAKSSKERFSTGHFISSTSFICDASTVHAAFAVADNV